MFNEVIKDIKKTPYSFTLIITSVIFGIVLLISGGTLRTALGDLRVFDMAEEVSSDASDELKISAATAQSSDQAAEDHNSENPGPDSAITQDAENQGMDGSVTGISESSDDDGDLKKTEGSVTDPLKSTGPADTGEESDKEQTDLGLFDFSEDSGYSWVNVFNNGITPVKIETPQNGGSRYYDDLGIIPETTVGDYWEVGPGYFRDACWIGDSRCLGISDYSGFASDFYCDNGYCFYSYSQGKTVTCQNTHKKVNIEEALAEKKYGKIYIMMGINDCGYGTTNTMREQISEFLDMLHSLQPDAVIFICANMHISENAVDGEVYTIGNIDSKNLALASFADGQKIYYLDYNDLFCDEEGYLKDELTFDGYHLYGSEYETWINFFLEHGIKTVDN